MNRWLNPGAVTALLVCGLAAPADAGPVMLIGDAADAHGPQNVYASLVQETFANVTNGQTGILALGVDSGSDAANWIVGVSALLPEPQAVAFISGEGIAAIGLSGYALIYIPSPADRVDGGLTVGENEALSLRSSDIAVFLDNGGGLVGLTQGDLPDPYGYLGDFAPISSIGVPSTGECGEKDVFDDVSATPAGELFGITDSNLDGCCWGNVYDAAPESFTALATSNEPGCPVINGQSAILIGFVELPEVNFGEPDEILAAGEPNFEAVGDLDGNGTVDVVAVIPDEDPMVNGNIQIFLNQGNIGDEWQGLGEGPLIEVGRNPSAVAVGLYNNDAHLDLAVTNANDDTMSILFNNGLGDGTFTLSEIVPTGDHPSDIVTGDFNLDGSTDLVVSHLIDENIGLFLNDGAGIFGGVPEGPGSLFGLGLGPIALTSGDFDGNKCPDMGGGGGGGGSPAGELGIVFVALDDGLGGFDITEYVVGLTITDISNGDLNGDGAPEIVVTDSGTNTTIILLNQGDGTFVQQANPVIAGNNPISVDVVDLNIDGKKDLAVVADDVAIGPAVQVIENLTDVSGLGGPAPAFFDEPTAFSVSADPNAVTNGDFNGDGLPDLVTVNQDDGKSGGSVTVLLNEPPPVDCEGDFNGDGFVNTGDFLALLANWGPCDAPCEFDLNGDGFVDTLDFLELFFRWGICPDGKNDCPWDITGDGFVDGQDIAELLQNLGPCEDPGNCPWDLDGDGIVGLLDLWTILLHIGDCEPPDG